MSWKRWLVNTLGGNPGPLATASVYGLGGRFFSRWLFQAQGETAGTIPSSGGKLTVSFDVDYPEDVQALPALCDRLAALGITACFAVVGALVERFPDEHGRLVEDGHELLNHTQNHPDNELLCPDRTFDQLSPQEQAAEIGTCGKTCGELLGVEPAGFRAPHFGNVTGREFYRLLAEQGYRYSSSRTAPGTESFGLPFRAAEGVWEFPVSTCPRHPFAVLDSWHALRKRNARHLSDGEFAGLCREAVTLAERHGGYLNLYLDPRDAIEYEQAAAGLAELAPSRHSLEIVTYSRHLDLLSDQSSG